MSTVSFVFSPFIEAVAGMLLLCLVILVATWSLACLLDSARQFVLLIRSRGEWSLIIEVRRNTPSFSYGDIRRVPRICASN